MIISSLLLYQNFYSCSAKQFAIIDEIVDYEKTLDPNACITLSEKITELNYECNYEFEIPDCG